MKEAEIIQRTGSAPVTAQSLTENLITLGLTPGIIVLVHSSLSSLGWVCGGAVAVVQALQNTLTREGTLVMPTHSGDLSDPETWSNPPVPATWWSVIKKTMPPYNPAVTPTRGMGAIPECFRTMPDVYRSGHPHYSFAAWGKYADEIVQSHSLNFGLSDESPLGELYRRNGRVLLLGVGHDSNTSLHLAEYRADFPLKKMVKNGTSMLVDQQPQWVKLSDIDLNSSDFEQIGASFKQEQNEIRQGTVGLAAAQLMPQRRLVDFATQWIENNRRVA